MSAFLKPNEQYKCCSKMFNILKYRIIPHAIVVNVTIEKRDADNQICLRSTIFSDEFSTRMKKKDKFAHNKVCKKNTFLRKNFTKKRTLNIELITISNSYTFHQYELS